MTEMKFKAFRYESDWDDDSRYHTIEYFPETNELVETTIYGWPTASGIRREEIENVEILHNPTIEQYLNAARHGFIIY